MYEPIQHRINRNFYEANLLKSNEDVEFNYQSMKELQIAEKIKQQKENELEQNANPFQFDTDKLMMNPEGYRSTGVAFNNITKQINESFETKNTSRSPWKTARTENKVKIIDMMLNSENNRVVGTSSPSKELPISILK